MRNKESETMREQEFDWTDVLILAAAFAGAAGAMGMGYWIHTGLQAVVR